MAERLIKAGHSLTVFNRTEHKTQPLAQLGAHVANSLEAAASETEILFTSVIDDQALLEISKVIIKNLKRGAIHVSTSTILPKTAENLAEQHQKFGSIYIAAPVLGTPNVVQNGKAFTICSGEQKAIEKITSLLSCYSETIENLGTQITDANVLKICMNYSLITALELISELYAFAEKSGLNTQIIQKSLYHIYAHPGIKHYIDKIYNRDFDHVNFDLKGGNKDVDLFQKAFTDVGVIPDIANVVKDKFNEAITTDLIDKDWSAVSEVVRKRSGLSS